MGFKESLSLDERLLAAYSKKGKPAVKGVHGAKRCFHCGMTWGRDANAARNIAIIFLFMAFNGGKRPFLFKRLVFFLILIFLFIDELKSFI